jgi:anti-sigma B factor antagonist
MEDIISGTYFADDTGKIMIVKLQGYIDQTNSYGLQKVFDDIIKSGCYNVIIDFTDVMYISSAGWGIFVGEIKHFRDENGDIKLSNMSPDIYDVYQMLEFYHIFEDFNSVENAKKSFTELSGIQDEAPGVENFNDQSLEIELGDSTVSEEKSGNILEISTVKNENLEISDSNSEIVNIDSDNVEIAIDENMDSGVETVDTIDSSLPEPAGVQILQPKTKPAINLSRLPLHEKIKKLVSEYPLLTIFQMNKLLKDERFGTVKINIIKLYKLLKQLDLETKIKRYRYYRSC